MDGLKARLNDSLQFRLSAWLSLVILLVATIAGSISFLVAYDEANEFQDDMLRQTASLFDGRHLPVQATADAARVPVADADARVIVRTLPQQGPRGDTPAFPSNLHDGVQTVELQGTAYRVFVRTLGSGPRIAVAQQAEVRNEAARAAALDALIPFALLVPILLVVVAALVRRFFGPVAALAEDVDRRAGDDLAPIEAGALPREIRPFVIAINGLLQRVAESISMQRRFVAAAAHELRSPLTALSLQAERLASAAMPGVARQRLDTLRQGIERNRALLDQLLTLARAQLASPGPAAPVSVQAAFRRVLEDLVPLIESRRIDLGLDGEADARVCIDEVELGAVLRNLVSNAIRHSPQGGRIDLSITPQGGHVLIEVEDQGPGIPEAERERVFEAFHREQGADGSGSGLGLSIVRTVVERCGGWVRLEDAARSPTGLRAIVAIPAASAG